MSELNDVPVKVIVKMEKDSNTGEMTPILFFPDQFDGTNMDCWSQCGEHSHASYAYYRNRCKKVKGFQEVEACRALNLYEKAYKCKLRRVEKLGKIY